MLTSRVLPVEEYARLAGTELEAVAPLLPESARVVVVEDDAGTLVGCWALCPVYHAEGVWIHPAHRGRGRVAVRLLEAFRRVCAGVGVRIVATASASEAVDRLMAHLGAVELPGRHFVFKV